MNQDDLQTLNIFLSSHVEPELIKFLLSNHRSHIGGKLSRIPEQYRDISVKNGQNDNQIDVSYPRCGKDDFSQSTGLEISYFDKVSGTYLYLGNFCIKITVERIQQDWEVVGYSYKYWYAKNSYILNSGEPLKEINFNFRLDWDVTHESEGLTNHVTFLHSVPRIHSKNLSIKDFLSYLEASVLPYSISVANGLHKHIGQING